MEVGGLLLDVPEVVASWPDPQSNLNILVQSIQLSSSKPVSRRIS